LWLQKLCLEGARDHFWKDIHGMETETSEDAFGWDLSLRQLFKGPRRDRVAIDDPN